MVPDLDALLRGIHYTTENTLVPELQSKFARTQALALLQTVDILRDRLGHQQVALLDETAALREGLDDVARTIEDWHGVLNDSVLAELRQAIADQLARTYAEYRGQRTLDGLDSERRELRQLHVHIMHSLCDGPAFDDPELVALRARLRARHMRVYGFSVQFTPVWAD